MELTHEWLRSRGFRLCSTQADNRPHLVRVYGPTSESALELCEPISASGWFCWLRSDLAHTRCRFVFVRHLRTAEQLEQLWLGLTDEPLVEEPYDPVQFRLALLQEREDCERRYHEYCREHLRYGSLPGG